MPTVSGKLIGIDEGEEQVDSTLDFILCGYGSRFPVARAEGSAIGSFCAVERNGVAADGPGGSFSVNLVGNDVIDPPGTYYTVTTRDANGDILQCNAYLFLEAHGDYDLDYEDPFDPVLPLPPLPPLIVSQLLIVPSSATPNFPGDQYTAWGFSMNQDVTASTLSGIIAGNLYTFIITNGNGGGWKFKWPSLVLDGGSINPSNSGLTIQTFIAIADRGPLLPIAGGTWYP